MLTKIIVAIMSHYVSQVILVYTLNLPGATCQLFLNEWKGKNS